MSNKVIDLAGINREEFDVRERGDFVLVTPRKSKHVWQPEEMHLRSLLCRKDGEVVSSGFSKFRNYGEDKDDDRHFRGALARGAVEFPEKLDGTLIILSCIDGIPHMRTRGNDSLGEFTEPVLDLIAEQYPNFFKWYLGPGLYPRLTREGFSLLFEYTAPDNRIVVPYDEPALTFLAAIDLHDLQPVWDLGTRTIVEMGMGVPSAKIHSLPTDFNDLMEFVKEWQDKEGVVARFVATDDGITVTPKMVKIKASSYVKLHAIKFKLREKNVWKLAFLLGAKTAEEVREKFFEMGIDAEAQAFVQPDIDMYVALVSGIERAFAAVWARCLLIKSGLHDIAGPSAMRRVYVERVREFLASLGPESPPCWFNVAMALYDGKVEEARITAYASLIFGEGALVLKNWLKNPMVEASSMLTVPDSED